MTAAASGLQVTQGSSSSNSRGADPTWAAGEGVLRRGMRSMPVTLGGTRSYSGRR